MKSFAGTAAAVSINVFGCNESVIQSIKEECVFSKDLGSSAATGGGI